MHIPVTPVSGRCLGKFYNSLLSSWKLSTGNVYLLYPGRVYQRFLSQLWLKLIFLAGGSFQFCSTWEEVRVSVHRPVVSTYQHYQHYNTQQAASDNNNKRVKYEGRKPTISLLQSVSDFRSSRKGWRQRWSFVVWRERWCDVWRWCRRGRTNKIPTRSRERSVKEYPATADVSHVSFIYKTHFGQLSSCLQDF